MGRLGLERREGVGLEIVCEKCGQLPAAGFVIPQDNVP